MFLWHQGDSNQYPKHMFLWRNKQNCLLIITKYPLYLFHYTLWNVMWNATYIFTIKGWDIAASISFSFLTCSICLSRITSLIAITFSARYSLVSLLRTSTTRPNVPVPVKKQMSHLMRLWHFSSSRKSFFKRACAASSGARCLIFCWTLCLLPYFMCANSEGSGTDAQARLSFHWSPMW